MRLSKAVFGCSFLTEYPNHKAGDSAEVTLDRGSFRLAIPFLTQSHAGVLIGTFREKCDRKPKTVVVTLIEADREYDRVSLDLAKDFKKWPIPALTLCALRFCCTVLLRFGEGIDWRRRDIFDSAETETFPSRRSGLRTAD